MLIHVMSQKNKHSFIFAQTTHLENGMAAKDRRANSGD